MYFEECISISDTILIENYTLFQPTKFEIIINSQIIELFTISLFLWMCIISMGIRYLPGLNSSFEYSFHWTTSLHMLANWRIECGEKRMYKNYNICMQHYNYTPFDDDHGDINDIKWFDLLLVVHSLFLFHYTLKLNPAFNFLLPKSGPRLYHPF